jgi:hypothetical protein
MTIEEKQIRQLPQETRRRMARLSLKRFWFERDTVSGRWLATDWHGGQIAADSSLEWLVEYTWRWDKDR